MSSRRRFEIAVRSGLSVFPPKVKKKVLLVIDIDYGCAWGPGIQEKRQRLVGPISKMILQARMNSIPVVFVMLEDTPAAQLGYDSVCSGCDREANKLPPFLNHNHGYKFEPVFVKDHDDAFTNPQLAPYLKSIGAEELLLIGCNTFACVLETARGAINTGFDVCLLGDAVFPPFKDKEAKKRWLERLNLSASSKYNVAIK